MELWSEFRLHAVRLICKIKNIFVDTDVRSEICPGLYYIGESSGRGGHGDINIVGVGEGFV